MPPETSTTSLLLGFVGRSITPRKSKSRSIESIKEPDFSSPFSKWRDSLTKKKKKKEKHPKEHRRHRSDVSSRGDDDIEGLRKDLRHERKLLRQALRELAELRRGRDEIDGQRQKATSDLKRLRDKNSRREAKISGYKRKLRDQDVTLDQFRASIRNLRGEVVEKEDRIDKLTTDGTKAKLNLERLREKLGRELVENSRLKSVQAEVRDPASHIRLLQTTYDELSSEFALSQDEIKTLKDENTLLEKECTRLRNGRDEARLSVSEMEVRHATQAQEVKTLTQSRVDLETFRDLVQPLLQVGVDIRLRNLEAAREPLLKIKPAQKDRAIMLSGNVAAHRANGATDAAMFMAGLIPEDYLPAATEIFEKLYQVAPTNYGSSGWSPMILRMVDCHATIATIQVQHHFKKFDTSHLRNEHDRLHGFLVRRQKKLSKERFEEDDKAKGLLARIEDIMEEIVDLSRGKAPKGKGRKIFEPYVYEESEDEEKEVETQKGVVEEVESDESDDNSEDDNDDSEGSESFDEDDSSEEEDKSEDED
ncbi:hypothetical protein BKA65DRAFT_534090 [Rhexocercosporidium sp. MPI-PUGE-AT-0058]|nr:hypothetical protein BKA65DRAFT_534090 [Rhexocercosporidium sp. MPI-PUGE-AT-0058]